MSQARHHKCDHYAIFIYKQKMDQCRPRLQKTKEWGQGYSPVGILGSASGASGTIQARESEGGVGVGGMMSVSLLGME